MIKLCAAGVFLILYPVSDDLHRTVYPGIAFSGSIELREDTPRRQVWLLTPNAKGNVYAQTASVPSTISGTDPYGFPWTEHSLSPRETVSIKKFEGTSDFNADSFINGLDYDEFVAEFRAGSSLADYDGNGFVNGDDFDLFSADFINGV